VDLHLLEREVTEGSTVTGTVLADADGDLTVRGCEVALLRKVSYLYRQGNMYGGAATVPTRSTEVVCARGLPCAGPLRAGGLLTVPFSLDVPAEGPGTVTGALVQIQWVVRVRIQVQGSPPTEATRPIVVLSRAAGRADAAGRPPTSQERGLVAMHFESLSSRSLVPGATITGMLALDPRRAGGARGLRVELLLREQVHRGPWVGSDPTRNPADESREKDTVVARQVIAHHIEMDPDAPVALPFELRAPARLRAPSLSTDQFSLSWILRGVADRALRPDPYVEVELHGASTLP